MAATRLKALIIFFFIGIFFSCKKKSEPFTAPEPTIELVSVAPTTVTEFKDSILIKIKYKDSNGDLGDVSPDEQSLQIKDSRLPTADAYHIIPLAPISDKDIAIEGELTVKLNSLFLIGSGTSENTTFVIKLKDRSGHWSNEITSPQITIMK